MGHVVAFYDMLLGKRGVLTEASLFRARPNHVHTYFILPSPHSILSFGAPTSTEYRLVVEGQLPISVKTSQVPGFIRKSLFTLVSCQIDYLVTSTDQLVLSIIYIVLNIIRHACLLCGITNACKFTCECSGVGQNASCTVGNSTLRTAY